MTATLDFGLPDREKKKPVLFFLSSKFSGPRLVLRWMVENKDTLNSFLLEIVQSQ